MRSRKECGKPWSRTTVLFILVDGWIRCGHCVTVMRQSRLMWPGCQSRCWLLLQYNFDALLNVLMYQQSLVIGSADSPTIHRRWNQHFSCLPSKGFAFSSWKRRSLRLITILSWSQNTSDNPHPDYNYYAYPSPLCCPFLYKIPPPFKPRFDIPTIYSSIPGGTIPRNLGWTSKGIRCYYF